MNSNQQSAARFPGLSDHGGRLVFIDGLRGLAALAVMAFHFYTPLVSPLYTQLSRIFVGPIGAALLKGHLGVEVFFVISGFVISYTIRNDFCSPAYAVNFMIRRSIRLDPPYWLVIAIAVGYRCVLWHKYALPIFIQSAGGMHNLLVNMFYLMDLLPNHHRVVGVAWTLCLELQFYLTLVTLAAITQSIARRWPAARQWSLLVAYGPLTIWSIYLWFGTPKYDFSSMWFMFFLGVVLCWTITEKIHERWLWIFVVAVAEGEMRLFDWPALMAIATVVAVYVAARRGKMYHWLSNGFVQHLGKISYSLYLIHAFVGLAVIDILRSYGDRSRTLSLFAYFAAMFCSIGAATWMQKFVEAPFVRLAHHLKPQRAPRLPAAYVPPLTPSPVLAS